MQKEKLNILIAEEKNLIAQFLKEILESKDEFHVVGIVSDGKSLLAELKKSFVDVLITELKLPELNGMEVIKKMHEVGHRTHIIILSNDIDKKCIRESLALGVKGFLTKNAQVQELTDAIMSVTKGGNFISRECVYMLANDVDISKADTKYHLTSREVEIIQLISDGFTSSQIADRLYISPRTVDSHRRNIMRKCKAKNTAAIIKIAHEAELLMGA